MLAGRVPETQRLNIYDTHHTDEGTRTAAALFGHSARALATPTCHSLFDLRALTRTLKISDFQSVRQCAQDE